LLAWAVIPVADGWAIADINVGILYIFAISSLGVYGVIMAGWASNSKYPFLGALRSAAQMVSYEVSIGFVIITVLLCVGSLNLSTSCSRRGHRHRHASRPAEHHSSTGTGCRCSRCSSSSSSRRWPRPTARPSTCPRPNRNSWPGFMVEYSSTPYMMFMLGEYVAILPDVRADDDPVPGRLAAAIDIPPFTWLPGVFWFVLKLLASSSCSPW
jgi:NADH-quinone oxidoreductase subunit H